MASSQSACCSESCIGRATLNQQLNPQWPMLTGRARLSATRLVPPAGEQAERSLPVPAAYGGDYFQRLRDVTLQDHIVNAGNALLHRVRSSAVRAHFGRCGSGWNNVNSYRDYSGRNYLFVDGQSRERDELFRHVKRRYVRSYTQPECAVEPELRYRTHSHAATARPNLDLQWTRAHALSHQHEHHPYEVEQAHGGASSIDVTRILSSALRSDAQRGGSRYSWHREDLL